MVPSLLTPSASSPTTSSLRCGAGKNLDRSWSMIVCRTQVPSMQRAPTTKQPAQKEGTQPAAVWLLWCWCATGPSGVRAQRRAGCRDGGGREEGRPEGGPPRRQRRLPHAAHAACPRCACEGEAVQQHDLPWQATTECREQARAAPSTRSTCSPPFLPSSYQERTMSKVFLSG